MRCAPDLRVAGLTGRTSERFNFHTAVAERQRVYVVRSGRSSPRAAASGRSRPGRVIAGRRGGANLLSHGGAMSRPLKESPGRGVALAVAVHHASPSVRRTHSRPRRGRASRRSTTTSGPVKVLRKIGPEGLPVGEGAFLHLQRTGSPGRTSGSSSTTYNQYDAVSLGGTSYISPIADNLNNDPETSPSE